MFFRRTIRNCSKKMPYMRKTPKISTVWLFHPFFITCFAAVSMTNGISRSRSDSTSLSRNAESNIPRSLSRISEETSGLQNDAFSDTYPLTHETILPKRCVSGIVRTFSREMNNRSADEETALLDSSPFGNPKTLEENRSSSSSLISSDLDSFDENQSESGEDDEDEEGFEVESTF